MRISLEPGRAQQFVTEWFVFWMVSHPLPCFKSPRQTLSPKVGHVGSLTKGGKNYNQSKNLNRENTVYLFKHQRTMYELLENCNDFFNSCTFYQTVSTRYMDMSKRTGPNRQPRNCKKLSTSVCCKLCLRSRTRMNHKQLLAFFLFHKYDKSFSYLQFVNM